MWSLLFPLVFAAGFFGFFKKSFDDLAASGLCLASGFLAFSWAVLAGYWFFGLSGGFWLSALLGLSFLIFSVKKWGLVFPDVGTIWQSHKAFCVFFLLAGLGFSYLGWTHYVQVQPDGWYSSGNTWGDLPFHLGVINYFLRGQSFPPRYVIIDSVLGYPFIPDLSAAALALGSSIQAALVFSGVYWFLTFLLLSYRVGLTLGISKHASVLALILVLFSGGLGFADFLARAIHEGVGSALMAQDYTILQPTGWTNVVTSLFLPQRTLLMGAMVFAAVFFLLISASKRGDFLLAGILSGLLPLVHWHAFLVALGVAVAYAVLQRKKEWIWFFLPAVMLALPQVAWSLQQLSPASLIHFQPNWVANTLAPLAAIGFWFSQTGIWLLAVGFGIACVSSEQRRRFLPFGILFFMAAFINVQPYAYDNLKFFFFVQWVSAFLVAAALVWFWQLASKFKKPGRGALVKLAVGLVAVSLVFSGALSVAREANLHWRLYDANDLQLADWVKAHAANSAVFLTSTAHNHPVSSLAGRFVVMGYPGWLWSHGFNYGPVQADVAAMYSGNAALLSKYHVTYVVVDAKSRQDYSVNDSFLSKLPVAFENPTYRLYAVG